MPTIYNPSRSQGKKVILGVKQPADSEQWPSGSAPFDKEALVAPLRQGVPSPPWEFFASGRRAPSGDGDYALPGFCNPSFWISPLWRRPQALASCIEVRNRLVEVES